VILSDVRKILFLLSARDRRILYRVTLFQILLGFLDLIAVGLIGVLAAISSGNLLTTNTNSLIDRFLAISGLEGLSLQQQVAILGLSSATLLIIKTLLSMRYTKKIIQFLSFQSEKLAINIFQKLLTEDVEKTSIESRHSQYFIFTSGATILMLGVLSTVIVFIVDITLIIILGFTIFIIDPYLTLGTLAFFVAIALVLQKSLGKIATQGGGERSRLIKKANSLIDEAMGFIKVIRIQRRESFYLNEMISTRKGISSVTAELLYLPHRSKFALEIGLVFAGVSITAYQFLARDAAGALVTLSIFLASSFRIAPAVIRTQQSVVSVKKSVAEARDIFPLLQRFGIVNLENRFEDLVDYATADTPVLEFTPRIELTSVSFSYFGDRKNLVNRLNLVINPGMYVAVVGKSGAGKTTLVDLMSGVLLPNSGEAKISGLPAREALARFPGKIAYLPQATFLVNGSIRENLVLGYPPLTFSDTRLWKALETVRLERKVRSLENGLDTRLGEFGSGFSGGENQRLGLARALLTDPTLMFLDEPTSALDEETQQVLIDEFFSLKGSHTIVVIAHRVETVKLADLILEVGEDNTLRSISFDEFLSKRNLPK
jgi:ABC-type multidrug transport system fused ATPase/permease subunit